MSGLIAVFLLAASPTAAIAQFVDTFDTINAAWVANRYDPASFTSVMWDGDNRLQLSIDQSGSAANRDITVSGSFYDLQGRERPGLVIGPWMLSAQVYVSSDFNTVAGPLVSAALWGHSGTTPGGGAYMILEFTNASPTNPLNPAALDRTFRFRAFDPMFGNFVDLGVPASFTFDAWHLLSGTATGSAFEYRIDGELVNTFATADGADLLSAMVQSYNFGAPVGYSVYWDNVSAVAIPEPAEAALATALAVLGLAAWRGRFRR